ncbi:MAG TPA: hypothetical protein VLJ37_01785 [bacterium]|nr:hypothetical protein [bacterium]
MTLHRLYASTIRTAFLGGLSIATASCGKADPTPPTDEFENAAPSPGPSELRPDLPSDRTVAELYRLTGSPGVQGIMALFHASWCEPCKIVETPEYQRAIREFNEAQSEIRVVTLRVDNEADPLVDPFWDIVGPVPVQVTHIKTGEEEIVEDSIIPSALLVYVPSGKYARSMKIPPNPETVEPWARRGFRHPERFEKSFPRIAELKPK